MQEQMLAIWREIQGERHPDTHFAQRNLALTVQRLEQQVAPCATCHVAHAFCCEHDLDSVIMFWVCYFL
jgi:hypothetical protein